MATKAYYHQVPHSTYICSKGLVHAFDGGGKLLTDEDYLQKEIEAAIKAGAHFRTQAMMDAEKLASMPKPAPAPVIEPPKAPTPPAQ